MPIYEFECSECESNFEIMQKMSDPVPEICEKCGKKHTLHKKVSSTSFHLKGGGWYKDLYSSTKPGESSTSSSTSSATKAVTPAPGPAATPAADAQTSSQATPKKAA